MTIPVPEVVFKSWEEEIRRMWAEGNPTKVWKWGTSMASPKASFIKGYLTEHGEGYIKELWQAWNNFVDRAKATGVHFKRGSYTTMRHYVWLLWKLDLIRLTRRGSYPPEYPLRKGFFERTYFAMHTRKVVQRGRIEEV